MGSEASLSCRKCIDSSVSPGVDFKQGGGLNINEN